MTYKQLAELEANELAEIAAYMDFATEQATAWHMEQAMRAVNEVSKQHNRTAMTFGMSSSANN